MTTAATPMIIPRSVRAERSLCAQMAAAASFNVSMNFMVLGVLRLSQGIGCIPRPPRSLAAQKYRDDFTESLRSTRVVRQVRTGSGSDRVTTRVTVQVE